MHRPIIVLLVVTGFPRDPAQAPGNPPPRIVHSDVSSRSVATAAATKYAQALSALRDRRAGLLRQYGAARGDDRRIVICEARELLLATLLRDILPAWYGTPWAFEGTSETPGQGQIACGYFVTTTLWDAGFQLPRVRLAQQASQVLIRSLCEKETIKLFYDRPMADIVAYLDRLGAGIYIVGLDCHTGFVVNDGTNKAFIHSSYFTPPRAVCADPLESRNPLTQSSYRMIGRLLGDTQVVQWLTQDAIPMKTQ